MDNVIRFGENFIEMEFIPDWAKVKSLWEFSKSVIQLILYDSNKSDLISMAGVELVENAVKYTIKNSLDDKKVIFRLDFLRKENKVTVIVTNPALKKDIEGIGNSIEKLSAVDNKRKIYLQKLLEYAKDDIDEETMELGIMRVMVEANAKVFVDRVEEKVLSIRAIFNVERKL